MCAVSASARNRPPRIHPRIRVARVASASGLVPDLRCVAVAGEGPDPHLHESSVAARGLAEELPLSLNLNSA